MMTESPQVRPSRFDVPVSVFFPCYNEAGNIERVTRRAVEVLDGLVSDWEIIIVDDGSSDDTGAIADRLAREDTRIRVVHHATNGGYGLALRSGFEAATRPYVFYTDGDGQFDIAELQRLLELRDEADIISGYRRRRRDGLRRKLFAAAWGFMVQRLLGFRCRDVDSAFKLYRREIFDRIKLRSTGALIDAEILARAARAGYTIRTVPVTHLPREAGEQTGSRPAVVLRAFRELLALWRDIRKGD